MTGTKQTGCQLTELAHNLPSILTSKGKHISIPAYGEGGTRSAAMGSQNSLWVGERGLLGARISFREIKFLI